MKTQSLGYPRIGDNRELKKANENYWSKKISQEELVEKAKDIRKYNWKIQKEFGIDLIPSNDFSFYDQVLDMSFMLGAIPKRYSEAFGVDSSSLDLYFAMARGIQTDQVDLTAMEMTKWFDTNYHYIVPEFYKNQKFKFHSRKIVEEFLEAKALGIISKPVLIAPVSYLLLGKEKEQDFHKLEHFDSILAVYLDILEELDRNGATYIQFDEPFLNLDLSEQEKFAIKKTYEKIKNAFPNLKIIVATYFEGLKDNASLALSLSIDILHLDLVRCESQLSTILENIPKNLSLSLGVIDGRNIWKNQYSKSLNTIKKAIDKIGEERVLISTSCSLLHCPCDLDNETDFKNLPEEVKQWMSFAKQKLNEMSQLKQIIEHPDSQNTKKLLSDNEKCFELKMKSDLIHKKYVAQRLQKEYPLERKSIFSDRKIIQSQAFNLPILPTTTIGSFPQTKEVRSWRAKFKKGEITSLEYKSLLEKEIKRAIEFQENIGIDLLVHGEFERNDMVEYFGEQLEGFAFSKNGWVQSYGSRCVKPPIIYGDVSRPKPMTVDWITYAQSITKKPVKGMLTGPVTILQWSFVRNDQPRELTCKQIALAIRDEVLDLEKAGIKFIQIDEPAIREGLPLRKEDWKAYLKWAISSFKLSSVSVEDDTQIHTHMCYSEFNDIMESIAAMDADVITIECSKSDMKLLDAFSKFNYPNDIGPGIYDIHSPRIPTIKEMKDLVRNAESNIPISQLWINPDCGLKTRGWKEVEKALIHMVETAKELRKTCISV